ncbi:MAG: hypothetical protein WC841_05035 [Candidatus Shapirobacteria bacterium]|jgi:hypothetical protein
MKKKKNISDKAIELINQQKIRPIPRWEFVAKNWGLWLALTMSLGALVLGTGVSWFGVVENIITPYLWLLVALVFLGISFFLFEKTKRAYRFSKWWVIAIIGIVGLIIGGVLFRAGVANKIDRRLETTIPFYRQMVPMKLQTWNRPELGYLSGTITKVADGNNFEIKDFGGNTWSISGQNILVRGRTRIETGAEIKLVGTKTGEGEFLAEEIRPWAGRRN